MIYTNMKCISNTQGVNQNLHSIVLLLYSVSKVFHWFCWRVGKEKQCMIIPFQHTNDTVYLVHVTFICISVWYHFTLTSSYRWKPHKSLPDQYKQRSPRHKDLLLNLTWKVPQVCSPELCTEASLFNTSISFQWGDQMHPQ